MNNLMTDQQLQAGRLLASGMTKTLVAEKVGVCRNSLYAWLRTPEFQAYLRELTDIHYRLSILGLASLDEQAKATVEDLMQSPDELIRLRAAQLYYATFQRSRDADVASELSEIKEILSNVQS